MDGCKYKLSIIIPMYNAEKYIETCLDSILNSDLPKGEYEVVIVNDGSTDDGVEISQRYVDERADVRMVSQDNQGLSMARNRGIQEVNGEYVWFVDADDRIGNIGNMYQTLCENTDIDILGSRLAVRDEGSEKETYAQLFFQYNHLQPGRQHLRNGYSIGSVCGMIIRRQFLVDNNLFFKPGITHQDMELSIRMFCKAERVLFVEDTPYIYIRRGDSISQSPSIEKQKKYQADAVHIVKTYYQSADEYKDSDPRFSKYLRSVGDGALFGLLRKMFLNRKEWKNGINAEILDMLRNESLYPVRGWHGSMKRYIFACMVNIPRIL